MSQPRSSRRPLLCPPRVRTTAAHPSVNLRLLWCCQVLLLLLLAPSSHCQVSESTLNQGECLALAQWGAYAKAVLQGYLDGYLAEMGAMSCNPPLDCYSYPGISCNAANRIERIKWPGSSYDIPPPTGTLPAQLGRMTHLTYLNLADFNLTGPLPSNWSTLTRLEELYLHNNSLTGLLPPEWSTLISLKTLSLGRNKLTGTLPSQWGNLMSLSWLGLAWNNLSGTIPEEWGKLANITYSSFINNPGLEGPVPVEWRPDDALPTTIDVDGTGICGPRTDSPGCPRGTRTPLPEVPSVSPISPPVGPVVDPNERISPAGKSSPPGNTYPFLESPSPTTSGSSSPPSPQPPITASPSSLPASSAVDSAKTVTVSSAVSGAGGGLLIIGLVLGFLRWRRNTAGRRTRPVQLAGGERPSSPLVFLSHAGEQKYDVVDIFRQKLLHRCNDLTGRIFLDEESLKAGDIAWQTIQEACQAAAIGVVFLSEEYVQKEYPMKELNILLDRTRALPESSLPVMLAFCCQNMSVRKLKRIRESYKSDLKRVGQVGPVHDDKETWVQDLEDLTMYTILEPSPRFHFLTTRLDTLVERVIEVLLAKGVLRQQEHNENTRGKVECCRLPCSSV